MTGKKQKVEVFSRTQPWYEITPASRFIYRDKSTKLWFVIEHLGRNNEVQGAGYALITAYHRYCDECTKGKKPAQPLDSFEEYDMLERVASYQVRN